MHKSDDADAPKTRENAHDARNNEAPMRPSITHDVRESNADALRDKE